MTVLHEVIEIGQSPEEAFDAVADFTSAQAWDPGVVRAERVEDGGDDPSGVGARYRLVVSFRGNRSEMTYVTTEYERPSRVVLEGDGPRLTARDTIGFEPAAGGGTRIVYEADLRLKGMAKLAEPALKRAFGEMGKKALAGMQTWFAERGEG